jgi:S1-C subfamily serine protease
LRYLTKILDCSQAALISVVLLWGASTFAQEHDIKNDIPSIAREALKSVVTVETKDEMGKPLSLGSGFVVSSDGKVITNYHVIQGAASGEIRFHDGASYLIEGMVASNPDQKLGTHLGTMRNFTGYRCRFRRSMQHHLI